MLGTWKIKGTYRIFRKFWRKTVDTWLYDRIILKWVLVKWGVKVLKSDGSGQDPLLFLCLTLFRTSRQFVPWLSAYLHLIRLKNGVRRPRPPRAVVPLKKKKKNGVKLVYFVPSVWEIINFETHSTKYIIS